jgi:TolB-like protein/Tfp pilus assembly protein PilF
LRPSAGARVYDIFLSYNREDQAVARRFAAAFEDIGLSVWWDVSLNVGDHYDVVTEDALRTAAAVVVLWSQRSVQSRWVRAEATVANRNRTLVPCMIEPCERPIMFELTQTTDLAGWNGDTGNPVWQAFAREVSEIVSKKRQEAGRTDYRLAPSSGAAADVPSSPPPPSPASLMGQRGSAPLLAILPFANRSGVESDDVFSVGMVEDLINALSQGVHVRVLTSSATAAFRTGGVTDLSSWAAGLGVRYVLEGNVRRSGDSLRVTSQLVEAASGTILWAQRFDRPLNELADLQEELVLEVAAHLNVQVYRLEMERALRKPAKLTAWEAVTRASSAYRQISGDTIFASVDEARRAIEIAPDYPLGHAMLAMTEAVLYLNFTKENASEVKRIRASIDRALSNGSDSAQVLAYVGHALLFLGLPDQALRHAKRAVQLSPATATGHGVWGGACTLLNQCDEAMVHFEDELRASPGAPTHYTIHSWQANTQIRAGNWDAAMHYLDSAIDINPAFAGALVYKAILLERSGDFEGACDWFMRTREADPSAPLDLARMRMQRFFANAAQLPELSASFERLWAATEAAPAG